ncbi:MAG: bifunctional phosphopantothenoylcysteine decarboxylase/phosphopantothenate--cysteine ligase CoaBC [Pseudomonadota bacterium]
MLAGKRILLIIGAGIAAYKSLELIRLLKKAGASVTPVLTPSAQHFVTPLTASALAGEKVQTDLFDLTAEAEMGHIELSRNADLVVVAPATADLMAKLASGLANDLASTLLLATDKRVLIAPAMNVRMWEHPANQRNVRSLRNDGVLSVGPESGDMACGEFGPGRMAEPADILEAISAALGQGVLTGRHILLTSGPTHEPIDPVRYIANRSSGRQGTAIAEALARRGARVSFITGPAEAPRPLGCRVVEVQSARDMLEAVTSCLPADVAVFAAAVADWHVVSASSSKLKKGANAEMPRIELAENPDILKTVSRMESGRPNLVIGFAAETDNVIENAREKRVRKGCDWLVANDVRPETGVMGGTRTELTLIREADMENWGPMTKVDAAERLADRIAAALS